MYSLRNAEVMSMPLLAAMHVQPKDGEANLAPNDSRLVRPD